MLKSAFSDLSRECLAVGSGEDHTGCLVRHRTPIRGARAVTFELHGAHLGEVRGVVAKLLVGRCSEECDGEVDDFGAVQVAAADQGVPGWEGNEVGCSSLEATSARSGCRLVRQ